MKTIGEQAKDFRESKGWNTTRMAREVGTSRQNIENLETRGNSRPRYLEKLAHVMKITVDDLLAGRYSSESETSQATATVQDAHALTPVVMSPNHGTAFHLIEAINTIRSSLISIDPKTRQMVSVMLSHMALDPDTTRTADALLVLLGVDKEQTAAQPAPVLTQEEQAFANKMTEDFRSGKHKFEGVQPEAVTGDTRKGPSGAL